MANCTQIQGIHQHRIQGTMQRNERQERPDWYRIAVKKVARTGRRLLHLEGEGKKNGGDENGSGDDRFHQQK